MQNRVVSGLDDTANNLASEPEISFAYIVSGGAKLFLQYQICQHIYFFFFPKQSTASFLCLIS